jgi:hypothetical protein
MCPPISPHARYGWLPNPSTEYTWHGPRDVIYVTDEHSNRTSSLDPAFDPSAPTILIGGESISEGIAVRYEETFASLIEHDLSIQVVDTGVVAYTMDQAYLRELDTVPALPHLVAIITSFVPEQVERPEMETLPSLQPDENDEMTIVPAVPEWLRKSRLRGIWRGLYHSDYDIDHMRFIARLTERLARNHGAYPLFMTTNYLDRCLDVDGRPPALFRLLFDDQKIPRVHIDLPASQRAEGDTHPGPLSHRQIATEIERALHDAHVL